MSEIYEMGKNGLVKIDQTANEDAVKVGQLIRWGGNMAWLPEHFVIVKFKEGFEGVKQAVMVSLKDFRYHNSHVYDFKYRDDLEVWHSQHMFIEDEIKSEDIVKGLIEKAEEKKAEDEIAFAKERKEQEETIYINQRDTAKMMRKDLKKHFPKVKFSVRCESYSMGGVINISWTDGVTKKQVDEVLGKYSSSGFDSSVDYQYSNYHYLLPNGEIIYAGTEGSACTGGYIEGKRLEKPKGAKRCSISGDYSLHRELSKEIQLKASKVIKEKYSALKDIEAPETEEDLGKGFSAWDKYYNWYDLSWKVLKDLDLTDAVGIKEDESFKGGCLFDGFVVVQEVC